MIITIDGPAGAGKSTAGRLLAEQLGFRFFESGSVYRALALSVRKRGLNPDDWPAVRKLIPELDFFRPDPDLYLPETGRLASLLSAIPEVRKNLLVFQRKLAEAGNLVAEGRDMGSVVFPAAEVKFYLEASLRTRAERRQRELAARGQKSDLHAVEAEIAERDGRDRTRAASPLVIPAGAIVIDTTGLSLAEVVETLLRAVKNRPSEKA